MNRRSLLSKGPAALLLAILPAGPTRQANAAQVSRPFVYVGETGPELIKLSGVHEISNEPIFRKGDQIEVTYGGDEVHIRPMFMRTYPEWEALMRPVRFVPFDERDTWDDVKRKMEG